VYVVVGKLSDTGMAEGVFASPVMNSEESRDEDNCEDFDGDADDDIVEDLLEVLESMPRGIYYLGKDLNNCANREWVLCQRADKVVVVIPPDE
jgi:hypothetical protein